MRHIDLQTSDHVSDAGLRVLSSGCPSVQHTDLSYRRQVSDEWLWALSAGCPNLHHIDLGDASLRALRAAARICSSLTCCPRAGQRRGPSGIERWMPEFAAYLLVLLRAGQRRGPSGIERGFPNLHHIELSYCEQVSDAGLWSLSAAAPRCSTLTCLTASRSATKPFRDLAWAARVCSTLAGITGLPELAPH